MAFRKFCHKAVYFACCHAFMYLFLNHVEDGSVDFPSPPYAFNLFGSFDEASCGHKTAFVLEFHDAQVKGCGLCALRQGPVFSFLAHVVDFFSGCCRGHALRLSWQCVLGFRLWDSLEKRKSPTDLSEPATFVLVL